ncbi:MAG: alpha/beta fold hydrolase [Anaerolineaceae bacterium]|nr:alpha/beta fold hydrolase [Anaerolineaceae bacterium]
MNAIMNSIQPFFFGPDTQQLYGTYQPGVGESRPQCAVLLCYPLGDEYIRVHRSYRQLALRLNRLGFPVLRFDYSGTGDSAGNDLDASLAQWGADIALASEELKRRSGMSRICLVGLRLGAALALLAGMQRSDVTGMVLWEPVVNGAAYLESLAEAHRNKLYYLHSRQKSLLETPSKEFLGFQMSDAFYAALHGLDLLAVQGAYAGQVCVVESEAQPSVEQLRTRLVEKGCTVNHQLAEGPAVWAEDPDKALVPDQVLRAIVTWMGEVFA